MSQVDNIATFIQIVGRRRPSNRSLCEAVMTQIRRHINASPGLGELISPTISFLTPVSSPFSYIWLDQIHPYYFQPYKLYSPFQ